ncbi:hypothetical protein [Streptodolium elevatio]|uniref:Uncharacterized protein n=1 Tax=Streptodolium elevatio TaxID=3157996 RepID=A0ABV3DGP0_9ACTN
MADLAGFRIAENGATWSLATYERYADETPALVSLDTLDDATLDQLAKIGHESPVQVPTAGIDTETFAHLGQQDGVAARIAEFNLIILGADTANLPAAIRGFFDACPGALRRLHVIHQAPKLVVRTTFVRMLATARTVTDLPQALAGPGFPAARAVALGGFFGPAFVKPALHITAPWVWASMSARAYALVVWPFGTAIPGGTFPSNQLADLVAPTTDRFTDNISSSRPTHTAAQYDAFLTWWVERVNTLLAIVTDPAQFPEPGTHTYSPDRQFQMLMSLERLFRDVAEALQHHGRDQTACLRAAYDALDCLEGLGIRNFRYYTSPSRARDALDRITAQVPTNAVAVLRPVCDDAVNALDRVRDGFYSSGPHWTANGLDGLPGTQRPSRDWDQAVADYLRLDRNTAHSFSKMDATDRAIYLAHDGELPSRLASLALLALVDLLADLDKLDAKLGR